MENRTKLRRPQPSVGLRQKWGISTAVSTFLLAMPALALAHGGMGPDEIGPPIMTSGLIGFVSYWVVMLWPSAKKKENPMTGAHSHNLSTFHPERRPKKRSTRVKRRPQLRKIEGNAPFDSDQHPPRRKASDG